MSEAVTNGTFNTPATEQDFDTLGFQGSMQQILSENIGSYVVVDFLIGTNNLSTRQGYLYFVGTQFLVLYDEVYLNYVVCDIFSVKFVTFLMPGCRTVEQMPGMPQSPTPVQPTAATVQPVQADPTMTQAAYAHALRRPLRAPVNTRSV